MNVPISQIVYASDEIFKNNNWQPFLQIITEINQFNSYERYLIIKIWIEQCVKNLNIYAIDFTNYNNDFANIKQYDIMISAEYAIYNNWTKTIELFNAIINYPIQIQMNVVDFWYGSFM
jgi:hypothetical protein